MRCRLDAALVENELCLTINVGGPVETMGSGVGPMLLAIAPPVPSEMPTAELSAK